MVNLKFKKMANEVATTKRKVLIYSTVGNNSTEIESGAKLWNELQAQLQQKVGIENFTRLKCVVGETKVTLESPNAVLPEGNFTLFVLPKKNKSGIDLNTASYKEMKAMVKDIIADNPDTKKTYFTVGGKNWTQLSTDIMRKSLQKYFSENAENTANVADVVESVANSKEEFYIDDDDIDRVIDALGHNTVVSSLSTNDNKEIKLYLSKIASILKAHELEVKRQVEEELRKEKEEKLKERARNIASEFDDVKNW